MSAYSVLGIPDGSSLSDAQRAYKRLAKLFHPDSGSSSADASLFDEITRAIDEIRANPAPECAPDPEFDFSVFSGLAGFADFAKDPIHIRVDMRTMLRGGSIWHAGALIEVPMGCMTGDIVAAGMGARGFVIEVEQHRVFRRLDRLNFETHVTVPIFTFIVGGWVTVPLPDGSQHVHRVDAGEVPPCEFSVPGKGVTWQGMTGDLRVKTDVWMPRVDPMDIAELSRILLP